MLAFRMMSAFVVDMYEGALDKWQRFEFILQRLTQIVHFVMSHLRIDDNV